MEELPDPTSPRDLPDPSGAGAPPESAGVVRIACDDCVAAGTSACADCLVTFLHAGDGVADAGTAVVLDFDEAAALRRLQAGGLVPRCRHRRAGMRP